MFLHCVILNPVVALEAVDVAGISGSPSFLKEAKKTYRALYTEAYSSKNQDLHMCSKSKVLFSILIDKGSFWQIFKILSLAVKNSWMKIPVEQVLYNVYGILSICRCIWVLYIDICMHLFVTCLFICFFLSCSTQRIWPNILQIFVCDIFYFLNNL